jgi:lipoprotein
VKLQFVEFFVAMAGIGIGCLLWWVILTYIVKKLSLHFGVGSLEWINRTVAFILIVIAVMGIYSVAFE